MLSEMSQTQRTNLVHDSTYRKVTKVVKFIETESRMVVTENLVEGETGNYYLMGIEF